MGIYLKLKNLLRRLKHILIKKENALDKTFSTEAEYYTHLFTESSDWNKSTPNHEEQLRWVVLKNFMFYIEGYNHDKIDKLSLQLLDLGCGRGWLSNLLSEYGNVTGIEPIQPVVEYAKTLFPDLNLICGNAADLITGGKTEYYDVIVCSEVIEHVSNDKKLYFLNEIKSLLKKGGFLILTTPRKDVEEDWKKYSTPGQPIEDWLYEEDIYALFREVNLKKHYLSKFSIPPVKNAPEIEIYQLWLVQKT